MSYADPRIIQRDRAADLERELHSAQAQIEAQLSAITDTCAIVIAVPVEGLDDSPAPSPMLMPRVYNWHPINGWVEEETDAPLVYPEFWWMPEEALLAPLMPAEI